MEVELWEDVCLEATTAYLEDGTAKRGGKQPGESRELGEGGGGAFYTKGLSHRFSGISCNSNL